MFWDYRRDTKSPVTRRRVGCVHRGGPKRRGRRRVEYRREGDIRVGKSTKEYGGSTCGTTIVLNVGTGQRTRDTV